MIKKILPETDMYFFDGTAAAEKPNKEAILARFNINGASPARPELARDAQHIMTHQIEERLLAAMPRHFSPSMRSMIITANLNTFHTLGAENQASYAAVEGVPSTTAEHELARMAYERGYATPEQALMTIMDLRMKSGELMKRTELAEALPEDLNAELIDLFSTIAKYQTENDTVGVSRESIKIKGANVGYDEKGLDGLIVSFKQDVATIGDGEYTVTKRSKYVIDLYGLGENWHRLLQKFYAHASDHCEAEIPAPVLPGICDDRIRALPEDLESHSAFYKRMREEREPVESQPAKEAQINAALLSMRNPDDVKLTLASLDPSHPAIYHFTTTVYVYRSH